MIAYRLITETAKQWWTAKCNQAKTLITQIKNIKREQAKVRKTIKKVKRKILEQVL